MLLYWWITNKEKIHLWALYSACDSAICFCNSLHILVSLASKLRAHVCIEPRPSDLNMTLPAFAAAGAGACSRYRSIAGTRHPQLSIDVCCPRPSSAASQPHAAAAVDRRDRQTDGLPTVTQTLLRIRCGQRKQQNVTLRHPSRAHSQDNWPRSSSLQTANA